MKIGEITIDLDEQTGEWTTTAKFATVTAGENEWGTDFLNWGVLISDVMRMMRYAIEAQRQGMYRIGDYLADGLEEIPLLNQHQNMTASFRPIAGSTTEDQDRRKSEEYSRRNASIGCIFGDDSGE